MSDDLSQTAEYVRNPSASIYDLRRELERMTLIRISDGNPGIDIQQVRQERERTGKSWVATLSPNNGMGAP